MYQKKFLGWALIAIASLLTIFAIIQIPVLVDAPRDIAKMIAGKMSQAQVTSALTYLGYALLYLLGTAFTWYRGFKLVTISRG